MPKRTDCMLCYGQRIGEWYGLWRGRPDEFQKGVDLEERIGHTFRSPRRDTWPAALKDLREEFESGRLPRGYSNTNDSQLPIYDEPGEHAPCRVCRM